MMSSCWQITFTLEAPATKEFESFIEDYFEVTAQNYADNGQDEYVGYLSGTEFDAHSLEQAAQKASIKLPPFTAEKLESSNWLKDYVIRFAPFEVADFMIYGIHEPTAPATQKIPLQIYAATAFGSDHQTTRSCLQALSDLYHAGFTPQRILDVGTGSGILSLAAASLWPQAQIIAVDIDEEAVLVTRSNAENNNLSSHMEVCQSDGYRAPLVQQNGPYDLILANILARPLLDMAPDLNRSLKPHGRAIISGFVKDQCDWIISAHQSHGILPERFYELDNWCAAVLQKA